MNSWSKSRIEAFSDGVIAILITIMIIELHVPAGLASRLDSHLLSEFLPTVAAYSLSFLVIGIMWVNHHHLLATIQLVTRPVLWANVFLLFTMSFVPLATAFLGEHPLSPIAAATYGGTLFTCGTAFTMLLRAVVRQQGPGSDSRLNRRYVLGLTLYGAATLLGLLSPWFTWFVIAFNAALFFLPQSVANLRHAQSANITEEDI